MREKIIGVTWHPPTQKKKKYKKKKKINKNKIKKNKKIMILIIKLINQKIKSINLIQPQ